MLSSSNIIIRTNHGSQLVENMTKTCNVFIVLKIRGKCKKRKAKYSQEFGDTFQLEVLDFSGIDSERPAC